MYSQINSNSLGNIASNFLTQMSQTSLSIDSYDAFVYESDTTLFIYNYSPEGFAIIPNSEYCYPIFAFSFKSNYVNESVEDSLMLINYSIYIQSLNSSSSKSNNSFQYWNKYKVDPKNFIPTRGKSVGDSALIETVWHQAYPYNDQCPDIYGSKCIIGCVPLALAQIINYWEYPGHGIGKVKYLPSITVNGFLTLDCSSHDYNYNLMPDSLGPADSPVDELSEFLYNIWYNDQSKF